MKTDFKVYKRKINVYVLQPNDLTGNYVYLHSTNAYRTCKEAKAGALKILPEGSSVRACFSRA